LLLLLFFKGSIPCCGNLEGVLWSVLMLNVKGMLPGEPYIRLTAYYKGCRTFL